MNAILGRTNIGWYAFLVCFPLSWYYLDRTVLIGFPYREGLTALLSAGNFLPLMVASVAAAWEGGRLSHSSLGITASVRHPLTIATISSLPAVVVVAISHLAATMIVLSANGITPPLPELPLYAGFLVLLGGISILSWFAGSLLTNVIGAPLMAVLVYFLAIMPSLTKHQEYRALVADHSGCCSIDQQVDWRAVATPFFLALGVVLISTAVAAWMWLRGDRSLLYGAIGCVALALGISLLSQMPDPWAVAARDADHLDCVTSTATSVTYCGWPEQQSGIQALQESGDAALTIWSGQHLLSIPRRVTMQAPMQLNEGDISVSLPPNPSQGKAILSLAIGSLSNPARCTGPIPESFDYFALVIWLALDAGVPSDDPVFTQFLDPRNSDIGPIAKARSIRQQPLAEQREWFMRNAGLLAAC